MLFGKNSDRSRNEAQTMEVFPSADYAAGTQLRCTYISVPQVAHTYATFICRPFWIWGAEMGANEHGVVIGNEGLRARSPAPVEEALTGMDLLRLALERSRSAEEAVHVLTSLLERHGQGGDCGHLKPSYYHNGYMIADAADAFVLETVDREWILERVHDVRSISNVYSIGEQAEGVSAELGDLIHNSGWQTTSTLHFADAIADPGSQHIGDSAARRQRTDSLLQASVGRLDVATMIRILRDHGTDDPAAHDWHPRNERRRTVCLHAGSKATPAQTTGSQVSEVSSSGHIHWATGTASPCLSIFKPVLLDVPLRIGERQVTDKFDPYTLWWRHERLHRSALRGDFGRFLESIRAERDALEAGFRARLRAVVDGGNPADRAKAVEDCWHEAQAMEDTWAQRMKPSRSTGKSPYDSGWDEMNRLAGVDGLREDTSQVQ